LSFNNGAEVRLNGAPANRAVFIRLPALQPGLHTLSIRPRRVGLAPNSQAAKELEGRIDLNVRDPRPRKIGTTGHAGLVASIDPPNPSLAEFWDGTARLSVLGPDDREVRCSIALTGATGETIMDEEIGRFALPINGSQWPQRIRRFTQETSRAWKYLDATKGRFIVKAEELGEFTLRLERDTTPLRWVCQFIQQKPLVRLIDDTGAETRAVVQFLPLERPGELRSLAVAESANSYTIEGAGGLYAATQGEQQDLLFVSAPGVLTLNQLLVEPNLADVRANVPALLQLIDLWRRARLAGPLAEHRRAHIVVCMMNQLLAHFCTVRWLQIEAGLGKGNDAAILEQLKLEVDTRASFAAVLLAEHARMSAGVKAGAIWFSEVCKRYGVHDNQAVCTFALHLASDPFNLDAFYGDQLTPLLESVRKLPVLMRGARLLTIAAVAADPTNATFHLPRWRW
jgi:hypothetical protein